MTGSDGAQIGATMKYLPFGVCRNSPDLPTDKLFTGQRLDATGLYYYNARYYDLEIGRFISPDTIIPNPADPQSFNRYSYCLNNPLKYVDPSGNIVEIGGVNIADIDVAMMAGDYMACWGIAKIINDAGAGNAVLAYGGFRQDFAAEAAVFENSNLIYNAYSETSQVKDLYVTNLQTIDTDYALQTFGLNHASASIYSEWHEGKVTTIINIGIGSLKDDGIIVFPSADINVPGGDINFSKSNWDYPVLIRSGTFYFSGSKTLQNGFPDKTLVINLKVNNMIMNPAPDERPYYLQTNCSWSFVIWEGRK